MADIRKSFERGVKAILVLCVLTLGGGAVATDYWSYMLHQEKLYEPLPATVHHFSSWARNGGNGDMGQYYGTDAYGWKILCDVTGPGVISEFWCTRRDSHEVLERLHLRVFVDDMQNWVLDTSLFRFFGHVEPFLSPLADSSTGAFYCYVPIPFQTRARITFSNQKGIYYHLTALEFEAGAVVEPFVIPPPPPILSQSGLTALAV